MNSRVAVVTGANKGIGFEIARGLGRAGFTVVLTSRDEARGLAAFGDLKKDEAIAHAPTFHQLNVTSMDSISMLAAWIQQQFGGLDVLVNNAGIGALPGDDRVASAEAVLATNFHGLRHVTMALLPLMRSGSRIVNMSSSLGNLEWLQSEKWRGLLDMKNEEKLSEKLIDEFIFDFMEDLKRGDTSSWSRVPYFGDNIKAYCVSKVALCCYTRLLARQLCCKKILVNSMHPGFIRTDITGWDGTHSAAEGAETAIWLATTPTSPSGKFFFDKQEISYEHFNECDHVLMAELKKREEQLGPA